MINSSLNYLFPGFNNPQNTQRSKTEKAIRFVCDCTDKAISSFSLMFLTAKISRYLPAGRAMIPDAVKDLINKEVTLPIIETRLALLEILPTIEIDLPFIETSLPSINYTKLALGAIIEEVLFRGIIQGVFLRDIPKDVLQREAPEKVELINHQVTKIARTVLVSLLFALAHQEIDGRPRYLSTFMSYGALTGYWMENNHTVAELAAYHFAHNVLVEIVSSYMAS